MKRCIGLDDDMTWEFAATGTSSHLNKQLKGSLAGAEIRHVPQGPGRDFLAGFKRAVETSDRPPSAVVLNYPSNPTAMVVDLDFYGEIVEFCRAKQVFILSDLAYSEIYFDDPPPSILQITAAWDIAVEFTSLSKTYAMPGWRIGFATGNRHLIAALARIKSYLDYGAFTPVQVAATAALNGPQDCIDEIRDIYRRRRDVMVQSFGRAGWEIPSPPATMFAWAPIPPAFAAAGSLEFTKLLLSEAKVAVSPGLGFGEYGEGHVRIALVENRERIRQAARNIKRFIATARPNAQTSTAPAVAK